MKERPSLFSAPMVRALLDDSKTQTRRVVKPQHLAFFEQSAADMLGAWDKRPLPYGQPGDRLWVRETFYAFGRWVTQYSAKKKRDEWHFIDMTQECGKEYRYAASMAGDNGPRQRGGVTPQWWKRPAIFMPRVASRITLEIVGLRAERLQDISEADAKAEGIESAYGEWRDYRTNPTINYPVCATAIDSYRTLWESLNGPGSWDANPLVWVVEFRRVMPC